MKPLRRKPKQLSEEPVLHGGGSGDGPPLPDGGDRRDGKEGTAPALTSETGALGTPETGEVDQEVLARLRVIASRLALSRPRRQASPRRGPGDLVSRRWRGASDDIDLDRTLEQLVEHPHLEDEHVVVREQLRTRRAVVLLVDVSGSMKGERIRTAAATVGALAGQLVADDLGVIAFWSDAALLNPLGRPVDQTALLEDLLRLPAQGLTNVAFPLEVAARELEGTALRDARVLLLSDCVHNAGPDPRTVAARLGRLDVLLDTSGEHYLDLARDLASVGRGRLVTAAHHRDVARALERVFSA
jgi:Mg-chelatase subunit ChlD